MTDEGKDKRRYNRLQNESVLSLKIEGRDFGAKVCDYSLGGIGLKVHQFTPIKKDDLLDIDVPGSSIKFKGKVVRVTKAGTELRLGIERLGSFRGNLFDYPLADVFLGVHRSGLTGMLHVIEGELHKQIYVKEGDFVFAMSNQPEDRMGDVLLHEGKITKEQYDRSAVLMEKEHKRHGAVLVELGYLKPQELFWAVKLYVEKAITGLFKLRKANFEFKQGELPTAEVITLSLSVANLIYRGIKALDDAAYIKKILPPDAMPLRLSSDPLNLFQNIILLPEDRMLMAALDGKKTIGEIAKTTPRIRQSFDRSLAALLSTRIIEVSDGTPAAHGMTAEDIFGKPEDKTKPQPKVEAKIERPVPEERKEEKKPAAGELSRKIVEFVRKLGRSNHYEVFGVKKDATVSEIKKAYYMMAKEYHPDKHFDLEPDMKGKLNMIFAEITKAYTTLTNPTERMRYDDSLTASPQGPSVQSRESSNAEQAQARFEEGLARLKEGNLSEASRQFAEAAYLNSSVTAHHYYYGLALSRLRNFKEAERILRKAASIEPDNPSVQAEMGHVFLGLGFPTRAKGHFIKALTADKDNARAEEGMKEVVRLAKEGKE